MSKKDYVHRDVSSGNILIVDGKGKLSDLEYAQIRGTGGRHGVRTVRQPVCHFLITYLSYMQGTIAFMAVEVANGYAFATDSEAAKLEKLFGTTRASTICP
jgi:serine/threonine protein kinase